MNTRKHYKHCFAVAAYGESPYLPLLLHSLKMQSIESRVIICTSTPNRYITKLSAQFGYPVYVRNGAHGLQQDWNFAYEMGAERSELVTIAHQDDLRSEEHTSELQSQR